MAKRQSPSEDANRGSDSVPANLARMIAQITKWRDELITGGKSNRLLYYKPNRVSSLLIAQPDEATILSRLQEGRSKGWSFYVPNPNVTPPKKPKPTELQTDKRDADALESALNGLAKRSSQVFIDKGIRVLYITFGRLTWKDPKEDEPAKSPLVLVPILIERPSPREPYTMHLGEDEPVLNPALAVKLRTDFGMDLPLLDDFTSDEGEIDFASLWQAIKKAVAAQKEWTLSREITVGVFSFHKEVMYRDLSENAALIQEHPAIQALVLGEDVAGTDYDFEPIPHDELDARSPPETLASILDADATQRTAIAAGKEGRSFVVDGPPGTGKSQTIANIIAELARDGKKVLFVSEKAAALDVVADRLTHRGLGDYIFKLHAGSANRKEVAQELAKSLNEHPRPPPGMSESDIARLVKKREALTNYAAAMNEVRLPLGRSLHQVLGRITTLQHLPSGHNAAQIDLSLTPSDFEDILQAARRLADAWDPIDHAESFHWRDATAETYNATTRQKLESHLKRAAGAARDLRETSESIAADLKVPWPIDNADQAQRLLALLEHAAKRPRGTPTTWSDLEPTHLRRRFKEREPLLNEKSELVHQLSEGLGDEWGQLSADTHDRLAATLAHLSRSDIPWAVDDDANERRLRSAVELLHHLPTYLKNVLDQGKQIAPEFGFDPETLSLEDARRLAELGILAGEPSLPESRWFEPHAIPILRQAVENLERSVKDYLELENELRPIYKPTILDQDLEGLTARFEGPHKRWFAFLTKQYREDKRAIAPHTHEGRASKRVKDALRRANEWKTANSKLAALEARSSQVTGGHYYKGTSTNFAELKTAVDIAHRALDLVGERIDRERLHKKLSVEATRDPATPLRAKQLLAAVTTLTAGLEAAFGESASVVTKVPVARAQAWCESILKDVQDLATVFEETRLSTGEGLVLSELKRMGAAKKRHDHVTAQLEGTHEADTKLLGPLWKGSATDLRPLDEALTWFERLHQQYGPGLRGNAAKRFLVLDPQQEIEPFRTRLISLLVIWNEGREAAVEAFAENARESARSEINSNFRTAAVYLDALRENIGQIPIWQEYSRARRDLVDAGFEPVIKYLEAESVERTDLVGVIERSALEKWADLVLTEDKRFGETRAETRDRLVEEFRELDEKLIQASAATVMAACNSRRPRDRIGGAGLIHREGNKKKKHMPIKKLLAEAGPVAQALKPCFMMSPLTVSQFLPPDLRFDAVIFDEASQVLPSDAINCIYRGDQLIVAGDQKQLPPTSFFHSLGEDAGEEYEEGQLDNYESILDQCKSAGFRAISLGWHYRSQHEHLITFSNHRFYSSRLITFPSSQQEGADLGVGFFPVVGGVYDRGGKSDNPNEAKVVVQRILYHARHHPTLTLGVVALSEAQMSAIEAELSREQKKPENMGLDSYFADDRLRGFFVKNLENVQGDERDIILLSIGYGKDQNGDLKMNFGPINKGAGWRRLNVAITRAKRRVEVISSITHTDFPTDLKNESVKHLRDYLRFAQEGPDFLLGAYTTEIGGFDSPFEAEVARVLRGWGHSVASQVGTAGYRIDLAIRDPKNPTRYVLGIECDGAMYHSGKVARDRDRLRESVLQHLGWRLHRIWGTAWYHDRDKAEERLRAAVSEALLAGSIKLRPKDATSPPDPVVRDEVAFNDLPGWVVPYQETKFPDQYYPEIDAASTQTMLKRMILQVAKTEGPISWDLAQKRVFSAWGIQVRARAQDAFERAVGALKREGSIEVDERNVLRTPGTRLAHVRMHTDASRARKIEEVPHEEILAALLTYVRDAKKMSREELTRRVSALFGWKRRGSEIQTTLDSLLEALVEHDYIIERGEHFEYGREEP